MMTIITVALWYTDWWKVMIMMNRLIEDDDDQTSKR